MIKVYAFKWVPPFAQGLVRDLRLRWALGEAGLEYSEQLIGLEDLATPEYRKLQPFGQIPVYEEGDLRLFESGSIVLHIANKSSVLMPADPAAAAQVVSWMFSALNTVEPSLQHLAVMDAISKGEEWDRLRPRQVEMVERRLDALATQLEGRDYLAGRDFSAADLLMTTVLRIARNTDLVERRYALATYRERCEARPAFQQALTAQLATYARHEPAMA